MQDPVGKNMPALGVGTQLRLVDCDEGEFLLDRHAFNGATIPARLRRLDPFFARDQRDILHALDGDNAVVDFARQQAQRKADHTAGVRAHPFNGQMRLASVGWA